MMEQQMYTEARDEFEKLVNDYSESEWTKAAKYQIALADAARSSGAEYDQKVTQSAVDEFEEFVEQYPEAKLSDNAKDKISELRGKEAENSYNIAAFYEKRKQYKSAKIYYQIVVDEYTLFTLVNQSLKSHSRINRQRMKKYLTLAFSLGLLIFCMGGCGYSTASQLANKYSTIYVETFENKITFAEESSRRNLYFPLLEVDTHDAIVDRFLFDGNLRATEETLADLTLVGILKNYRRVGLRFTDADNVEEYRVYITVGLELWNNRTGEMLWEEGSFVGEATYFVSGTEATSEEDAVERAIAGLGTAHCRTCD